jgi:hypothetical protein
LQLAHTARRQERLGAVDQGQGRLVGLARGLAPGDKTVVHEYQRLRGWGVRQGVADRVRKRQPSGRIGDRCGLMSERRGDHPGTLVTIGERQDGARVRVQHEGMRQHRVGQCLNRSSARRRTQGVASELARHDLVGHGRHIREPHKVRKIQGHEITSLHIGKRHARGFDEKRWLRFAEHVGQRTLVRRVATAVHGKVGLGPDEVRDIGKQRDLPLTRVGTAQPRSFRLGPPVLHQLALPDVVLGGLVELERLRWRCALVDDLAHSLDHGHRRFGLEDVAPHVHAGSALRDSGVGHL